MECDMLNLLFEKIKNVLNIFIILIVIEFGKVKILIFYFRRYKWLYFCVCILVLYNNVFFVEIYLKS